MSSSGKTEPRIATSKEIAAAISALTEAELLRINRYAAKKTYVLKALKGDQNWAQEIVQEALTRIVEGRKKWPVEQINFMTFLIQAIKNISGHEMRRLKESYEEEISTEFDEELDSSVQLVSLIDSISKDPASLIQAEQNMIAIKESVSDDPKLIELLDCKLTGFSPLEIKELMNLDKNEYEALDLRLKRRVTQVLEKGGSSVKKR